MPVTMGVAGGTGSGKTTVARAIAGAFLDRAAMIEQDSFYIDRSSMPFKNRKEVNYDNPDSIDIDLMIETLNKLKKSESVLIPQFEFNTKKKKKERILVKPVDVIVVEGILLFYYPGLRHLFDLKVLVQTDADIRLMRMIKRDVEERDRTINSVFSQYLKNIKPMYEMYVETSKQYADIILPEGGLNILGLETIISQLSKMLKYDIDRQLV